MKENYPDEQVKPTYTFGVFFGSSSDKNSLRALVDRNRCKLSEEILTHKKYSSKIRITLKQKLEKNFLMLYLKWLSMKHLILRQFSLLTRSSWRIDRQKLAQNTLR